MSIRFVYLRDEKNNPVGCIATQLVDNVDGSTSIKYAYSVCHPNDKFSKDLAKKIATSRLETNWRRVFVDSSSAHKRLEAVMIDIMNTSGSELARQSAFNWFFYAGSLWECLKKNWRSGCLSH